MRRLFTSDVIAGLFVVAVGATFALGALSHQVGTLVRMGSGYFPLVVGLFTILLGASMLVGAFWRLSRAPSAPGGGDASAGASAADGSWFVALRAAAAVLTGIAAFAFGLPTFGFVPAVFACALISSCADRSARPLESVIMATLVAGVSWLVFINGLGIAAPAFRWAL